MAKPLTLRFDTGPGMVGSWAVVCAGATCGGAGGNDRPCMSLHYGRTRGIGQRAFDGVSLTHSPIDDVTMTMTEQPTHSRKTK